MALGKILVVDDDKNICELLRLYLEKEGYSVILAHDGEEALLKFETLHPELILLTSCSPVWTAAGLPGDPEKEPGSDYHAHRKRRDLR